MSHYFLRSQLVILLAHVSYASAATGQAPQIENHISHITSIARNAPTTGADDCVAEETKEGNRNNSVLTVRLKVVSGRLAVDWQMSAGLFKPAPLFQCRVGMAGIDTVKAEQMKLKVEKQLLSELDELLLKQDQFVNVALQMGDASGLPPPPATLRESHNWETYHRLYKDWNESMPDDIRVGRSMRVALDWFLNNRLKPILADTPIRAYNNDPADDSLNDQLDSVNGLVSFHINDPIGELTQERDYQIALPPPITGVAGAEFIAPKREQIARTLAPLKGKFWRSKLVGAYLNDYFATSRSGYERIVGNGIEVSRGAALPKEITIPPVPQIIRIVFYNVEDDALIKQGLRQILTDHEFTTYLEKKSLLNSQIIKKCPDKTVTPEGMIPDANAPAESGQSISISCRYVAYEDLGKKDKLPYLNASNLSRQQASLASLGLSMGPGPFVSADDEEAEEVENADDENAQRFVELQITKGEEEKKDADNRPSATANPSARMSTNAPGTVPAPANPSAHGATTPGGSPTDDLQNNVSALKPRLQARCIHKPCLNFIGGGAVYRPGQGVRFYGAYERKRLLKGDLAIRVGNFGGHIISGEGQWDYLFFDKLNRRLSFQINGATDSTANRMFSGVETDERRTGGAFRAELELLTDPALLTLSFGGKRETIEITQNEKTAAKQNLTIFQTGAVFVVASKNVLWRRVVQLEPALRFDPGLGAGQKSFAVFSLTGLLHQYLPGRRDFIINGRVDVASKHTPLFEQPFLGGEDSVRGFRIDDAIGLRQWVLQHEFQFPVPYVKPESSGLLAMLRSQVQLAAFFDVGGMYRTTGSLAGTRFGPGLGVRFNYGPHVLKFDWAYGIGDGAQGRGHGRFYFSVSREIPRLIRQ